MREFAVAPLWWLDIGRSLREAFFMFWETLWPLILGFALAGMVQAFVSRDTMQRKLGDHRPRTLARATGYGVVSSSCSYAASAMAKSLFAKGADLLSTMIFMFASTNLVLELGVVLVVLMGWQFAASEFVGGIIMIGLLAGVGSWWLSARLVQRARDHVQGEVANAYDEGASVDGPPRARVRTKAAWADAASYTMADLTMVRRELVIGYLVAGTLAAAVPARAWRVLFWHGHGLWTTLENVVVGPFIAILSFVCSIGNVPLAAALWHGGIAFGGVVSFLFADLITFPLLLIYRRYYGTRVTVRLLGLFWFVMSLAGLATQWLFHVARLIPTTRPAQVATSHFSWNYTSYLNIFFLVALAWLVYAARHQRAWGGGAGYALDPVCGMQVETAHAPASVRHEGQVIYFCSDHCRHRFTASPARFLDGTAGSEMNEEGSFVDPVCGMSVEPDHAAATRAFDGVTYYFCALSCAERFDDNPRLVLDQGPQGMASTPAAVALGLKPKRQVKTHVDPVCGMSVVDDTGAATLVVNDTNYFFCSTSCQARFEQDPSAFM